MASCGWICRNARLAGSVQRVVTRAAPLLTIATTRPNISADR